MSDRRNETAIDEIDRKRRLIKKLGKEKSELHHRIEKLREGFIDLADGCFEHGWTVEMCNAHAHKILNDDELAK